MAGNKTDIYVYADWQELGGPQLMGVLSAHQAKGRKAFSFTYDKQWLRSGNQYLIDFLLKIVQDALKLPR